MIKLPEEMTFVDKKFSMIIYGSPGVGKTTLALFLIKKLIKFFVEGSNKNG